MERRCLTARELVLALLATEGVRAPEGDPTGTADLAEKLVKYRDLLCVKDFDDAFFFVAVLDEFGLLKREGDILRLPEDIGGAPLAEKVRQVVEIFNKLRSARRSG